MTYPAWLSPRAAPVVAEGREVRKLGLESPERVCTEQRRESALAYYEANRDKINEQRRAKRKAA